MFKFPKEFTGLLGLSTHKVYPGRMLPPGPVRSYRTFSPLPFGCYFLWHLLCPEKTEQPPVRWCGALRGPDFPPFHSMKRRQVDLQPSLAIKFNAYWFYFSITSVAPMPKRGL